MASPLFKRVLFAMFASAMVTIAAFAARKFTESVWKQTVKEEPPK